MEEIIFRPKESRFAKVRCAKCKNEQVIFLSASSDVKCLICGELLAESAGGLAKMKAEIIERYS
jgi:small subunit ribosomal protein S27e